MCFKLIYNMFIFQKSESLSFKNYRGGGGGGAPPPSVILRKCVSESDPGGSLPRNALYGGAARMGRNF